MSEDWKVKGTAVKATVDYIVKRYGEEALKRVIDALPSAERDALTKPILMSSWYDGALFVNFTVTADKLLCSGDLGFAWDVGEASAVFSLKEGPYKFYTQMGTTRGIKAFLERAPDIWALFYNRGTCKLAEYDVGRAKLAIKGGEAFPDSVLFRIFGFVKGGLMVMGCKEPKVFWQKDGRDVIVNLVWSS